MTKRALALAALALGLAACSSNSGGGVNPDDIGKYASMATDGKGTVMVSAYFKNHKRDSHHIDAVGALVYARASIGPGGPVPIGGWQVVDGDLRTKKPGVADVGQYTSLALSPSGLARISYYDDQNKQLKLATETAPGVFTTEVVDPGPGVGDGTSLVLENDQPRIAYHDSTNKALKFAAKVNGTWKISTLDGSATTWDAGHFVSMASDGNGNLGIAYSADFGTAGNSLAYLSGTTASGFGTNPTMIDSVGDVGRWCKLAFDLGAPRISYQDNTNQYLKLARFDNNAWTTQVVDNAPWRGADTSIAIDRNGLITLAYFDGLNNDALTAHWDGSTWTLSKVASAGANGYYNNVVLDASGKPIFGWYTFTGTIFMAQAGLPSGS